MFDISVVSMDPRIYQRKAVFLACRRAKFSRRHYVLIDARAVIILYYIKKKPHRNAAFVKNLLVL